MDGILVVEKNDLKTYIKLKLATLEARMLGHWALDNNREVNIQENFRLHDEALKTALAALDKRLEGMNEFRQSLNDQNQLFLTRNEFDTNHQSLIDKIDAVTIRVAAMEGQSKGNNQAWGYIVGFVGLVIGIATVIIYSIKK